ALFQRLEKVHVAGDVRSALALRPRPPRGIVLGVSRTACLAPCVARAAPGSFELQIAPLGGPRRARLSGPVAPTVLVENIDAIVATGVATVDVQVPMNARFANLARQYNVCFEYIVGGRSSGFASNLAK